MPGRGNVARQRKLSDMLGICEESLAWWKVYAGDLAIENAELIAIIKKLMVACESLSDEPDGYASACIAVAMAKEMT